MNGVERKIDLDLGHVKDISLKVLPSGSATWCVMENASMRCLPTNVHKECCSGLYYRNNEESHALQR